MKNQNTAIAFNDTTYTISADEKGILTLVPKPKKKIERRPDNVAMGAEFRRIRKEEGKTLKQLADLMRISVGYLNRIESGYCCPIRRYRQGYKIMNREFVMTFKEA